MTTHDAATDPTRDPARPTPSEVIAEYTAGRLDRAGLVERLSAYAYLPTDVAGVSPGTPTDAAVVHVEGSWDDVEQALFDGDIDRGIYDEVDRAVAGQRRWNVEESRPI